MGTARGEAVGKGANCSQQHRGTAVGRPQRGRWVGDVGLWGSLLGSVGRRADWEGPVHVCTWGQEPCDATWLPTPSLCPKLCFSYCLPHATQLSASLLPSSRPRTEVITPQSLGISDLEQSGLFFFFFSLFLTAAASTLGKDISAGRKKI